MKDKKETKEPIIQVLDGAGKALMRMPLSMCKKQKLLREIAIVFIKNKENQLVLTKKKSATTLINDKKSKTNKTEFTHLWDIPVYADIYADEFAEQSALRVLHDEFHLSENTLKKIVRIPLAQGEDHHVLATVFTTNKIEFQEEKNTVFRQNREFLFIEISELKAIIAHSSELFTSELFWAVQAGWIK